jgi:hypothetical protein
MVKWDWIKKNALTKKNAKRIYTIGFWCVFIWLILAHRFLIQNPPDISTQEDFKSVLLTTVNKQVLIFGCIYAICGFLFLLLRLPFLNIEQLKFFGFEYKVQTEKQEELANKTIEEQRLRELTRLNVIDYLNTLEVREKIVSFYNDYEFNAQEAVKLLDDIIQNFYLDMLDIEIETGYIEIQNEQIIQRNEFEKLQVRIRETINNAIHSSQYEIRQNKYSIIAVPLLWNEEVESYIIFYMRVYSGYMILNESDCLMIQIAWSIIKDNAYMAFYERALENIGV